MIVLLGVVLFLLTSPIGPTQMWVGFFDTVYQADQYETGAMVFTTLVGALLATALWSGIRFVLTRWVRLPPRVTQRPARISLWIASSAATLLCFGVGLTGLLLTHAHINQVVAQNPSFVCDSYPGECAFLVDQDWLAQTRWLPQSVSRGEPLRLVS